MLACSLFWWRAASADDGAPAESDARIAARVLAAQGSEAFEQHDFVQALALFQRAGAIIQAPTIMLMEARSLVELGRLVEALERYGAAQRMLSLDPENQAFRQAADDAQRESEILLQRIPTLRVRVGGAFTAESVELSIDGKKLEPAMMALDHPLDPGTHRVEAHGSAGGAAAQQVTLAEGTHQDVALTLVHPAAPAPPPPKRRELSTGSPSTRTIGWTLTIAGVGATAAGAITGALALSNKSDLDAHCNPQCPRSLASELNAFRAERTASYIGFGLGALGITGGMYLVLTHPARSHAVALRLTPEQVSIAGTFK